MVDILQQYKLRLYMNGIYTKIQHYIAKSDYQAIQCPKTYVFCYAKQFFNTGLYLKEGLIELKKGKDKKVIEAPAWIGVHEILNNLRSQHEVRVKKGSWIVPLGKNLVCQLIDKAT